MDDFDPQLHPRGQGGRFGKAQKLLALADSIDAAADAELQRPRLANTARRARMAGGAEKKARDSKHTAELMRRIASAQIQGTAGEHLSRVSSKAHVEELKLAGAVAASRAEYRGGKPSDHVSYVTPRADHTAIRWMAEHLEKQGEDAAEHAREARTLHGLASMEEGLLLADADLEKRFRSVLSAAKATGHKTGQEFGLTTASRLKALGVTDTATLKKAVAELDAISSGASVDEDPIKKLERELVGRKIPGFFPTPRSLGKQIVEMALLRPGMSVLEPSAGKGDLAEEIRSAGGEVTALERDADLIKLLEARKIPVAGHDALAHQGRYDRVIMNPPFENGADGLHVRHAYENNLKPGGRLVSIVGSGLLTNSDARSREFRDWLEERGGSWEMLPDGSFADPREAFRTTGVRAGVVTIDKPRAGPESSAGFTAEFVGPPAPPEIVLPPGSVAIDLAVARQQQPFTCGPAVLAGLSRAWGHPWGEAQWTAASRADEEGGAAPEDMVRALTSQGFGAWLHEDMTIEQLRSLVEQGIPVLCPIKAWSGGHWVAVVGMPSSEAGPLVVVNDPAMDHPLGHRTTEEWESSWHDEDRYGKVWRRAGIAVTRPPVTSRHVPREDPSPASMTMMGLDVYDRWLEGFSAFFARRDPSLWQPHVITRGPRKGVLVWKNVNTKRLADSLAAVHVVRGVPEDLAGASFEPGIEGVHDEALGVNHEVTGTVRHKGKRYFYKGVGADAGSREQVASDAALVLGLLTPNATHRAVAGAPTRPDQEGGVVAQWLEGETLAASFRRSAGGKFIVKHTQKEAELARLESGVLRKGEVDRLALFNFVLGVEDRHPGQFMVSGDRLASIDHDFCLWKQWSLFKNEFRDPRHQGAADAWEAGPLLYRPGGRDQAVFDPAIVKEMAARKRAVVLLVNRKFPDAAHVVDRHFRVLERMASTGQTSVADMRRFLAEELDRS